MKKIIATTVLIISVKYITPMEYCLISKVQGLLFSKYDFGHTLIFVE